MWFQICKQKSTGKNGASSHKTNYIDIFPEILNLEGHLNRCMGLTVTAILLNGWILPTGGVAFGEGLPCRLVFVEVEVNIFTESAHWADSV